MCSFEEDAGERCYDCCCQAALMCPSNSEAHQLMEALMKGLKLWLPSLMNGGGTETDREEMATPEHEDDIAVCT